MQMVIAKRNGIKKFVHRVSESNVNNHVRMFEEYGYEIEVIPESDYKKEEENNDAEDRATQ